jgi:predicted glycoside hydrolase/deacetylase ChbG (UPF0249 family)
MTASENAATVGPATAALLRPRAFVLCADDYAIAPGVSAAIRDLIERDRLSATSCMTVSPFWPEDAALLRPLADRADIGLHLTLTDHRPLGAMPRTAPHVRLPALGRLMALALARRLDQAEIHGEVARQVGAFASAFGRLPDFIDGHQHVHQLPVVRDAVLATFREEGARPGAYVRSCVEPATAILRRRVALPKTLLISTLGHGLRRLAREHGIPTNRSFRGVRAFAAGAPFARLFAAFLADLPAGALIMVHPGIPDDALRRADPVTEPRAAEYAYLGGGTFVADLAARHLVIGRGAVALSAQ